MGEIIGSVFGCIYIRKHGKEARQTSEGRAGLRQPLAQEGTTLRWILGYALPLLPDTSVGI